MSASKQVSLRIDQKWETHVWELLYAQFGIPQLAGYRFLRSGRKRIRLITEAALNHLSDVPYTGTTGLYVGEYSPRAVRLSMDGAQILGRHATKRIIKLTDNQTNMWLQGESINYKDEIRGYVIVMHNKDILGCGSLSQGLLHSFVPKVRRPKNPEQQR
jgi:NOL1/NOP2/fmu family ribosome biogenesis protein